MEELTKEQKISFITAASTAFLSFLAFIGLGFTLLKFIENRILGYRIAFLILILITFGLFYITKRLKEWLSKWKKSIGIGLY